MLKDLSGQNPVTSRAKYTIRSFGIKRNEEIGCHVSVRGDKAEELLKLGLKVKDNEMKAASFSQSGNFGFGINEHIDLGIKYDPNTGIYGMDFYACLGRRGARVSRRKARRNAVGNFQKVTKNEAQKWFTEKLSGILV